MSAAVIGRQLRQHNTVPRTSGPLVPPVYRGRPRTPSIAGRPYSPAADSSTQGTGTGDRAIVLSDNTSNAYSSSGKGHLSFQSKSKNEPASLNEEEPNIRCTWHCFCIAFKAISLGVFLLVAGSIMSVVGFIIENDFIQAQNNKPDHYSVDQRATLMMYRNLTYAGPVIMGLGAIVIVAGLVLTFEARDTLGVKEVPFKPTGNSSTAPVPVVIAGLSDSGQNGRKSTIASVSSTFASGLTASQSAAFAATRRLGSDSNFPMASIAASGVKEGLFDRNRLQETIQETNLSSDAGSMGQGASGGSSQPASPENRRKSQVSTKHPAVRDETCIFTTSSSSGSSSYHRHPCSIERELVGFQTLQDTSFSDPEACSVLLPDWRRSARCSCSASPTLSSAGLDFCLADDDAVFKDQTYEQQRLQHRLLQQQQLLIQQQQQQLQVQQRLLQEQKRKFNPSCRPNTASMESDGLSSASSSSDNLFLLHSRGDKRICESAQPHRSSFKSRTCYTTAKIHHRFDDTGSEAAAMLLHPHDAFRKSTSSSTSSHKQTTRDRHDNRFPLLRPPEAL